MEEEDRLLLNVAETEIVVEGGEIGPDEIEAYKRRAKERYGVVPSKIEIRVCGGDVELRHHFRRSGFDRIRRITGYLVGTVDRFNDAKRAEERERVRHGVGGRESR